MNRAPDYVRISERKVCLKTDFRTSIRFELLMTDSMVPDEDKLKKALKLYYGNRRFCNEEIPGAIDGILWFYALGKDVDEIKKDASKGKKSGAKRVYDYEHDADYIYSAFLQQYRIDLQETPIHWWKFKAMFKALTDDCEFVKIMGYRSIKINNNMTKSQKEFYSEMKRVHALPLPKNELQKIKAIEEALLNGGDLSGLIGIQNGPG